MTLLNPIHPGEIIREDVINYLGLSIKEAAGRLGVTQAMLSRVINCKAEVSPDLALRLEMAGVSTADVWLGLQVDYDKAQINKGNFPPVRALNDAIAA